MRMDAMPPSAAYTSPAPPIASAYCPALKRILRMGFCRTMSATRDATTRAVIPHATPQPSRSPKANVVEVVISSVSLPRGTVIGMSSPRSTNSANITRRSPPGQ